MRSRIAGAFLALVFTALVVAPASAANKEHQQLMADIRMLQEQAQLLQNMLGTLNDSIKAVNTRLDEQNNTMRKAFADQKLPIDNLSSDLRVVREKVDDTNVRIGSLREELEAVRQTVHQLASRPAATQEGGGAGAAEAGTPPSGPPPPIVPGASPNQVWDMAMADYSLGNYDLAIQGFESYLRSFPKSDRAPDAQVKVGQSYYMAGNKAKALEAYDKAIRDYPAARAALAEAWVRRGIVLVDLKQPDRAREAFEYVVKTYPADSAEAIQAKQALERMKKP